MARLFITGVSGLLGLNLALQVKEEFTVGGGYHEHPVALDSVETVAADLASYQSVQETLGAFQPDVIIHTAAYTDVNGCETNHALAKSLNVDSAANVAKVAAELGAQLVHISTDHLFDGTDPWRTEDDSPKPLNVYAATKLEGELAVAANCPDALVVRTNFYGWGSPLKPSFSDWILDGLREDRRLTMFEDSFFNPILINDLADLIVELVKRKAKGVYNVAGRDRLSKYSFAEQLAETFDHSTAKIIRSRASDQQLDIARPGDLSLAYGKLETLIERPVPTVVEGLVRLRLLEEKGWPEKLRKAIGGVKASQRPMSA